MVELGTFDRRRNSRRPSLQSIRRDFWSMKTANSKTYDEWQAENPGQRSVFDVD